VDEFEKKTKRLIIRVSARLKDEIDKAARNGQSAKFVRDCVEKNLEDYRKKSKLAGGHSTQGGAK
jgi:hypothetical protein